MKLIIQKLVFPAIAGSYLAGPSMLPTLSQPSLSRFLNESAASSLYSREAPRIPSDQRESSPISGSPSSPLVARVSTWAGGARHFPYFVNAFNARPEGTMSSEKIVLENDREQPVSIRTREPIHLHVKNFSGRVRLEASDSQELSVVAIAKGFTENQMPRLEVVQSSPSRVSVETVMPRASASCWTGLTSLVGRLPQMSFDHPQVDLLIKAPFFRLIEADLATSNGDIEVRGVGKERLQSEIGKINVKVENGKTHFDDVVASNGISIRNKNGNVTLRSVRSSNQPLKVQVENGGIEMAESDFQSALLDVKNGSIHSNTTTGGAISCSARNGNVTVRAHQGGKVTVNNANGSVVLDNPHAESETLTKVSGQSKL